ncbi:12640_t:CDS:2, partial [Entrophospora sp. SA101]
EISREEEVGTIIGQKQSYEKDLPSISLGKMEMIPQTIMQSNSKDDDLFLDDEINDVSAEVQQFIVKMKRDPDATEFAYRESFVNLIIPKAFNDVSANIRFKN